MPAKRKPMKKGYVKPKGKSRTTPDQSKRRHPPGRSTPRPRY